MLSLRTVTVVMALLCAPLALAEKPAPFTPDPSTVQKYGAGYRYPQDGWIVLHIEGSPYERGVQHGRLLAPEIAGYLRCYSAMQSPGAPTEGWKLTRTLVNTAFLRAFDREFMEEMQGIADGASGAGARFDGRAIDLIDVAALNLWPEIMTLDDANAATPTGLEGVDFKDAAPSKTRPIREGHCSAFAATGKATRDGHPVIGHITMFGLYPSGFFNVWLDVKPESGHRVVMQSYPAGIYSGMDYYLNDAGVAMVETTIDQTRFDRSGQCLASRVRKAMQYAGSIDQVVAELEKSNNGLYNNEWLLADMNTDEIAMLELGTHASKLWRSGKNEWFGGTEGFYWGCNNARDLNVRLETIPALNDRPANLVWHPTDRDLKWIELYKAGFGTMDEQFAKAAFTAAPLCSSAAVDAKFTTAAMARSMQNWCLFGPPRGKTWLATPEETRRFPEIRPLTPNPWTILGPGADSPGAGSSLATDLHNPAGSELPAIAIEDDKTRDSGDLPPTKPAWHGTILAATDADIWLGAAFADFERVVSLERGYADCHTTKCLCNTDYDKAAVSLYAARARYFAGVRAGGDVPLSKIRWETSKDAWYKIASGKGVLVLAELRRLLGDSEFAAMMDAFGRANAGKQVTTAQFAAHASKAAGRDLSGFFEYWLNGTGLPRLELVGASVSPDSGASGAKPGALVIRGEVHAQGGPIPANIEMTVENGKDETTQVVALAAETGAFEVSCPGPATRLVVDKYARCARANGAQVALGSFADDLKHTLIVYGTQDDAPANREAAEACQRSVRTSWHNITLPIRSDAEVTDADLADNHLILVGRPATNRVSAKLSGALPVTFGAASFSVRTSTYANAGSAVLVAGVNTLNPRYSINVIAGNSGAATLAHAGDLFDRQHVQEVRIMDAWGNITPLVTPAPELVHSFEAPSSARVP
jgi:hypothetical protein